MNIEYYNAFLEYQEKGLKKKAAACIQAFISSFESEDEIRNWVWFNLEDLVSNRHSRIRHEIFSELVYPVLKRGYLKMTLNPFSAWQADTECIPGSCAE